MLMAGHARKGVHFRLDVIGHTISNGLNKGVTKVDNAAEVSSHRTRSPGHAGPTSDKTVLYHNN